MKLETTSLQLRLLQSSDLQAVHDLHCIPEVARYNTLAIPQKLVETEIIIAPLIAANYQEFIINYTFVIETKEDYEFVGLFGLKLGKTKYNNAEIWYKLDPQHWNKGFATEAVKCVFDFGFNHLKLHRIHAGSAVENFSSINVLEKVGMIREGHARKTLPLLTGWSDNYEYAILDTDFIENKKR